MSAKSVYVTDVYRPGLSESKRFVFLDETECYEFTAAATATKWYRVETNIFEIQASSKHATKALKDAFGV